MASTTPRIPLLATARPMMRRPSKVRWTSSSSVSGKVNTARSRTRWSCRVACRRVGDGAHDGDRRLGGAVGRGQRGRGAGFGLGCLDQLLGQRLDAGHAPERTLERRAAARGLVTRVGRDPPAHDLERDRLLGVAVRDPRGLQGEVRRRGVPAHLELDQQHVVALGEPRGADAGELAELELEVVDVHRRAFLAS